MKYIRIIVTALLMLSLTLTVAYADDSNDTASADTVISTDTTESTDAPVVGKSYTISYGYKEILYNDAPPADYIKGKTPAPVSVSAGGSHTVLNNPYSFRDYVFVGWSDGSKMYSEGEVIYNVQSNISLTAVWKRGDNPTITIYGRLSYTNGTSVTNVDVKVGTTVTLQSGTWVDSDGRYFNGGDSFLISRHTASLTATTKPSSLVSVKYDGNGVKNGVQASFAIVNGGTFTVDGCFGTKDGYEFIGWKDAAGKIYLSGDSCTVSGDTSLIAQWQESSKPMPDYKTVSIKVGEGGTATPTGKQTVVKGESITVNITANIGYKLVSVKRDGEELGTGGEYKLTVKEDTKLEAAFERLPDVSLPESKEESTQAPVSEAESTKEEQSSDISNESKDDSKSDKKSKALVSAFIIIGVVIVAFVVAIVALQSKNTKKKRRRR